MSNVLLGGAIGDALGMSFESKPANNPALLNWDNKTFFSSEHHGLKAGQTTDDTQFSTTLAQSLIENRGFNPDDLSKRYVELFTSKTIRGYGTTTLLAINNLISGIHWSKSGIAGSFGNGSGMRVAPFSIFFRKDLQALIEAVKIDSAITHASEEAEAGALSIALTNYYVVNDDTTDLLEKISGYLPNSKVKDNIHSLNSLVKLKNISHQKVLAFFGTKADIRMTVPSVLYTYLSFDNYQDACQTIIRCGGDCDTNASILSAIYGAQYGLNHFSEYHVKNVEDSEKLIILDSQLFNKTNYSFFPR